MKIVVDAMGGDNAPLEIVKGAVMAAKEFPVDIILVGRGEDILRSLQELGEGDLEPVQDELGLPVELARTAGLVGLRVVDPVFQPAVGDGRADGVRVRIPVADDLYRVGIELLVFHKVPLLFFSAPGWSLFHPKGIIAQFNMEG